MMREHTTSSSDEILSFVCGVLGGAISGVLWGILFAPRSGRETQADMQEKLQALVNRLPDPSRDYTPADNGGVNDKARTLFLKTRANIESQVERVNRSMQSSKLAKAKVRESRSNEIYSENNFLDN